MTCAGLVTRDRGFSLLESLLACTLLTVGVLAVAALFAAATTVGARARQMTLAAIVAAQKLEELIAGPLAGDAGSTDFIGLSGEQLSGTEGAPPSGATFIRRWSVRERGGGPDRTFVVTVSVEPANRGPGGGRSVRLVTARSRPTP